MKITHIGHASILIETNGLRVLCDPWWRGPCFGSQWWIYPLPYLEPLNQGKIDYIYISHGHEDHFHPPTLRTLDRSAKLLVARGASFLPEARELGFELIEIDDNEAKGLGNDVVCRIVPTHGGDTFMTLSDGAETIVNLNDAIHPLPAYARRKFIKLIKHTHPEIDYLFCGHGVASHFPNCYVVPGKDREATAHKRQLYFNEVWADIASTLAPKYAFPFAADVVLLEDDLQWGNEPVHNTTRPTEAFARRHPDSPAQALDITSGFEIADGHVARMKLRAPLRMQDVREAYAEKITQANRYGSVRDDNVDEVYGLLKRNVEDRHAYLSSFNGNYRVLIRFRGGAAGLAIIKAGTDINIAKIPDAEAVASTYDVVFTTKLAYLQRSLSTRFGNDLLFVGSGGVFLYNSANALGSGLNDEIMAMVSPFYYTGSRMKRRLKAALKRLANRDELDLYNIERWTVFTAH